MAQKPKKDAKVRALQEEGAWNKNAGEVKDPLFGENEFFDAEDLVQVKYEMLRRVTVEKDPVTKAVDDFGFSRPSFYKAHRSFDREGMAGLLPKRPGPRRSHKLTEEIMEYVEARLREEELTSVDLISLLKERFGLTIHRRSIERALIRRKKK